MGEYGEVVTVKMDCDGCQQMDFVQSVDESNE